MDATGTADDRCAFDLASGHFLQAVEFSSNLIAVCRDDRIIYINRAGCRLLGAAGPGCVSGDRFSGFLGPEYAALMRESMTPFAEDPAGTPIRLYTLDDRTRDVVLKVARLDGTPEHFLLEARDITDHLRIAHGSERQHRILERIFHFLPEGVISIDETGHILSLNPAAERLFGCRASEVIGQSIDMFMPPRLRISHAKAIASYRRRGHSDLVDNTRDLPAIRRDGTPFTVELRVTEVPDGEHRRFIATARDVTEQRLDERRMRYLAAHDSLTGLPNRALLEERLARAVTRTVRRGDVVALYFLDLDHFKPINDRMGHEAGDEVLRTIARRLTETVRAMDTVARIGGDEFVVLIEQLNDAAWAAKVARKMLDEVLKPIMINDREVRLGASIGISLYPHHGTDCEVLLRRADAAMYRVKGSGRNAYAFFEPSFEQPVDAVAP